MLFPGTSGAGRVSVAPGGLGRWHSQLCEKSGLFAKWGRDTAWSGISLFLLLFDRLVGLFLSWISLFTKNSVSRWCESVHERDCDLINFFSDLKNEYRIYESNLIWAFYIYSREGACLDSQVALANGDRQIKSSFWKMGVNPISSASEKVNVFSTGVLGSREKRVGGRGEERGSNSLLNCSWEGWKCVRVRAVSPAGWLSHSLGEDFSPSLWTLF